MPDPVDIAEPLYEILRRLGLEPRDTRRLQIDRRSVTAEVYLRRDGEKYIGDDGEPAMRTPTFEVTT